MTEHTVFHSAEEIAALPQYFASALPTAEWTQKMRPDGEGLNAAAIDDNLTKRP